MTPRILNLITRFAFLCMSTPVFYGIYLFLTWLWRNYRMWWLFTIIFLFGFGLLVVFGEKPRKLR